MIIGVTGTRLHNTTAQLHTFRSFLLENLPDITAIHHGCCIGFDVAAAYMANEFGISQVYHPPLKTDLQGIFKRNGWQGVWCKPRTYLERNRDIVDSCDILIAGPKDDVEEIRSGTWATVRYARKIGREVKILRKMGGWLE